MTQEKVIRQLADQLGFISLSPQIHGEFKEYWYTITPLASSEHFIFAVDYSGVGKEAALRDYLKTIRRRYRFTSTLRSPNVVLIDMKVGMTTKGTVQKVVRLFEDFATVFPSLGLERACYHCGAQGKHTAYRLGSMAAEVCPSCVPKLEVLLAKDEEAIHRMGNYATGAVGGVLGSLLGSVLWLVLSAGSSASVSCIAMAYGASHGYRLFRGKVGKRMPAILFSSFFFALFAAIITEIAYRLYNSGVGRSFTEALFMAPTAFFNWKLPFIGLIWANLALGLFLGLLFSDNLISMSMDGLSPRHYEIEKL